MVEAQIWRCRFCDLAILVKKDDPQHSEIFGLFLLHVLSHTKDDVKRETIDDLIEKLKPYLIISGN